MGALPFFPFLLLYFSLPSQLTLRSPRSSELSSLYLSPYPFALTYEAQYFLFALRLTISALGEGTGGEITSATVLRHIFVHLCIGKSGAAVQWWRDVLARGARG